MLEKRYRKALNDISHMYGYLRTSRNGYNEVVFNENNFKKHLLIHRYIASVVFKKDLNQMDIVHHLDKDALNNHYTNLIVLNSKQHHILHHFCDKHPEYYGLSQCETKKILDYAEEYVDYLNGDIIHDLDVYKARINKRKKTGSFSRLKEMEALLKKIRDKRQKELGSKYGSLQGTGGKKPPKEKLLEVLERNMNMENSSYELGVTSNSVRKWCKSYGIDFKKYTAFNRTVKEAICPTCGKKFTYPSSISRKYCSVKCCERRVPNHINELEACALYSVFNMSFAQLSRLYQVDQEVIGRLVRKNLPIWNALDNTEKERIIINVK